MQHQQGKKANCVAFSNTRHKYSSEGEVSWSNALNLWNRSKPENEGRKPLSMQAANGEQGTANSYE